MDEKKEVINLKQKIKEEMYSLQLPGFMYQELERSLSFMNYYKLRNIWDNIDGFMEDLKSIKENYKNQIFYSFNKQKQKW